MARAEELSDFQRGTVHMSPFEKVNSEYNNILEDSVLPGLW
jgi:hypothetical protein